MNKNPLLKKYLSLSLILILCSFCLSGCYNDKDMDQLAYVVALGFDVGQNNRLNLSFQLSVPGGESSGGGSSSSSQSSNVVMKNIECSSLNSGINLLNSYISKKISLAHCKVVVFSEEIASQGLNEYIYTLINDVEVGPSTNIVVCKSDSKSFLENAEPATENLSARYYEIAPTSSEYTGYTADVTLGEFFSSIDDTFQDPFAILGSINNASTHSSDSSGSTQTKDSSYVAGETPITNNSTSIENMGLAVFSSDKFVGELNGIETMCHLMVTNELQSCIISIPSPFSESETIDLQVKVKKKTKNSVDLVNSSPFIHVKVDLKATILSMNQEHDYLKEENLSILETYANSYLEENISQYLYKTAKEYKSDIAGFGKEAVTKFLFWKDWKEYNWLSNYQNAFFDVDVHTNIRSGRLLLKT